MRQAWIVSGLLFVLALALAPAVFAEGLRAPGQPATVRNYPGAAPCNTTLQACLSGATAGDVISVAGGTYITGMLLITRAIALHGQGPLSTTLQADGAHTVISVAANIAAGVVISNLRVFSGTTTGRGAGIFADVGTPLTLQNMEVLSNTNNGNSGGGIYASASLAMTSVNVIGNRDPGGAGGGLRAAADVSIFGGRFERNVSSNPGGAMRVDGPLSIRGTQVLSNAITNPTTSGGGIRADGGLFMRNGLIRNNYASGRGGGVFASSADVVNTVFALNSAAEGGGFYVTGAAVLTGTTLSGNVASAGSGGALYAGSADLRASFVMNNQASADGGGVWVRADSAPAVVFASLLSGNTAGGLGGGVSVSGTLVITAGNVFSNTAANGGGAYAADAEIFGGNFQQNVASTASGLGGGLLVRSALSLSATQFLTNSAFAGGGAYISGTLVMTGGRVLSNTAGDGLSLGGAGGGIYVVGAAAVSDALFERNREVNFGTADGGGLFAKNSLTLSSTQFISNSTHGTGGGVHVAGVGVVTVLAGEFRGNQALQCGGLRSPVLNAVDTQFVGNTGTSGSGGGACAFTSASLTGALFADNRAAAAGGLLLVNGALLITDTQFISNSGDQGGGAVLAITNFAVSSRIVNSLFARNQSSLGAALNLTNQGGGNTLILHSTIADRDLNAGQAMVLAKGTFGITDTIVVSHAIAISQTSGTVVEDYNLFFANGVDVTGAPTSGGHSFVGNPAFANPAGDNYHLSSTSAAIDAGTNAGLTSDFDGDPRPFGAGFDIGFDEAAILKLFLPLVHR